MKRSCICPILSIIPIFHTSASSENRLQEIGYASHVACRKPPVLTTGPDNTLIMSQSIFFYMEPLHVSSIDTDSGPVGGG